MRSIYNFLIFFLVFKGSFLQASEQCFEMIDAIHSHQSREKILRTLPEDSTFLLNRNHALAMEIIASGGPLENYLVRQKVDLKTVTVYLFGSSASGRSSKNNRLISEYSDIDLWVDAKLLDGTPWMLPSGPNKAFKFEDKSVEVISSWDKGGFDQDLFNQLGIEIYEQPQKKKRYENSILLKSPEIDFLKIVNEAEIFKELDPYMISSFLASNGRIAAVSNETMIRQNEILDDLYIVLKADQIEVVVDTMQEKNISLIKEHLHSGVFGEKSAILGGETTASVNIKGDGLIYRISKEKLERLKNDYPDFENSVHNYVQKYLKERESSVSGEK